MLHSYRPESIDCKNNRIIHKEKKNIIFYIIYHKSTWHDQQYVSVAPEKNI
jgi:hypothetical protein